jgi:hypothetical protein
MSGDGGAEPDIVLDQELGEVLENDQEDSQGTLEEDARCLMEAGRFEEGVKKLEKRHQDPVKIGPAL